MAKILFDRVAEHDSLRLLSWWNNHSKDTFYRELAYKRGGKKFYTIFRVEAS